MRNQTKYELELCIHWWNASYLAVSLSPVDTSIELIHEPRNVHSSELSFADLNSHGILGQIHYRTITKISEVAQGCCYLDNQAEFSLGFHMNANLRKTSLEYKEHI